MENKKSTFTDKIVLSFMNAFSEGKSGGDVTLVETFARIPCKKLYITTSLLGKELCEEKIKDAKYLLTTKERSFNNIYLIYLKRIALGILKTVTLPKPDVLYVSSDIFPDVIPAFFIKLKYLFSKKRPIWIQKSYHINSKSRLISYITQRVSLLIISMLADKIITCSYHSKDELSKFNLHKEKISVNLPGVELEKFKDIDPSEVSYDALYLGRIKESKGIFDLIDIWELASNEKKDLKLAIIGSGDELTVNAVKDKIRDNNLEHNISLLGFLDFEETFSLLKSSKIFIFPSLEEGFGIVIAEAIACKVPVVAYDLPVYKGIFDHLIEKAPMGNRIEFSKAVIDLIKDDAKRESLKSTGEKEINKFSWEESAKREMELIGSLF